jgi:RNA polymerase sigma-70 factor (ECF subfamily)
VANRTPSPPIAERVGDPDVELVLRMARGDVQALSGLYERHAPKLRALALRILHDEMSADDVLHDVFLEAWRRSADYSPERGSVSAWLGLRLRSRAIDRLRQAPRSVPLAVAERVSGGDATSDDLGRTLDHARLRAALSSMSAAEQHVIVLGYFQGLTLAEIAVAAGVPIGTVKSRTRNALNKLRRFFDSDRSRS